MSRRIVIHNHLPARRTRDVQCNVFGWRNRRLEYNQTMNVAPEQATALARKIKSEKGLDRVKIENASNDQVLATSDGVGDEDPSQERAYRDRLNNIRRDANGRITHRHGKPVEEEANRKEASTPWAPSPKIG